MGNFQGFVICTDMIMSLYDSIVISLLFMTLILIYSYVH